MFRKKTWQLMHLLIFPQQMKLLHVCRLWQLTVSWSSQCCLIRHTVCGYSCNQRSAWTNLYQCTALLDPQTGQQSFSIKSTAEPRFLSDEGGRFECVSLQPDDNPQTSPLGLTEARNKSGRGSRENGRPMKSYLSAVFTFPFHLILRHRLQPHTHSSSYL